MKPVRAFASCLAFVALLIGLASDAVAAPVVPADCQPAARADIRAGWSTEGDLTGIWAYWWCPAGTQISYGSLVIRTDDRDPDTLEQLRDHLMGQNPEFLSRFPALPDDPAAVERLRDMIRNAAQFDPASPTFPRFKVAGKSSRPAYLIDQDGRHKKSSGRVASGTPCDLSNCLREGKSLYCAAPVLVALCIRVP